MIAYIIYECMNGYKVCPIISIVSMVNNMLIMKTYNYSK